MGPDMTVRGKLVVGLIALVVVAASATFRPPLLTAHSQSAAAPAPGARDTRERIRLAPAGRDAIVAQMRTMLQSLSRIMHGLVAGDLVMVEEAARASGMKATIDPRFEQKLPPSYLQLGRRVHMRFDQLADATRTGATRDDVLKRLAALTGYCVACHAAYRLEETP